ncbi:MAG TPA: hypothetical protein VMT76_09605 [Puia sp.]|nr:hypothetical protein [Puia sp.]
MRITPFKLAVLFIAVTFMLLAFVNTQSGSIKGKIIPQNAASKVWAISGTDTVKGNVGQGSFELTSVKQGEYKLIVEAVPPYSNATKEPVHVKNGEATDIGTITLTQVK